jgi:hypothetical protein
MMKKILAFIALAAMIGSTLAFAHSGRTDSAGCHHETRTGTYHCH